MLLGSGGGRFVRFCMTSGLASDSDKFKIIITLRRAQKFGDTGPYKNFDFLFNRLPAAIFFTEGFFTMFPNENSRRITVNYYCNSKI